MRPHLCLLLTLLLMISACAGNSGVPNQTGSAALYKGTVQGLEGEYHDLNKAKEQLDNHLQEALQEINDLQTRNGLLGEDLYRARADSDRLEKVLEARSEEAGKAMAEMRQAIDRLEENNRQLEMQLEKAMLAREARLARMKKTYDELVGKLEGEISRGEIVISELQGQLTVNLVERILFDSGKAELKPEGIEVLRRVGETLDNVTDKNIRVEGHTDNVPISPRLTAVFPTNWELSTARATTVLHFLQDTIGIPGERLVACGFGQHQPLATNDTPQGRAQNRRIQIVLVPKLEVPTDAGQ